ncbi:integrase, partial [Pseudomonas aeruginosa]
ASGALVTWYCESAGESQHALFEFLMYAWGKQEGRLIHGVPKFLLWDKGSANTSNAIKNLLDHLEVEPLEHAAGNARAKGGVEVG